jgi:DNA polymerase III subunit delta'
MVWLGVEGHDSIAEQFKERLQRGRLGSSFLFVGPSGIGKRFLARRLAMTLLCPAAGPSFAACGTCLSCTQIESGNHPDILFVSKPADRTVIPIDMFVGDREHRMREGLCPWMAIKPAEGGRRIAIIDDADDMSEESANALLKTLEEPPPRSVLILIGTSPQSQLPTIRSRCQLVTFKPLSAEVVARILVQQGMEKDKAEQLAPLCQGSLERASVLADPGVLEFRPEWYRLLQDIDGNDLERTRIVQAFIDAAGKESSARRKRLEVILDITLDFFDQCLHRYLGLPRVADPTIMTSVEELLRVWKWGDEGIVACLDRTLSAQRHVEANSNVSTNLEAWLDDLMRIARGGPFVPAAQPLR